MPLNKYQVFVKVAETQNLTKVANDLECSQPAIGHVITCLEDELGFQLISRGVNGIALTTNGEKLLEEARRIVKSEAALAQQASILRGSAVGSISVGSFSSVTVHWLPAVIEKLRCRCPGISLSITNHNYHGVMAMLDDKLVDCGFLSDKQGERYDFVPLAEDEYFVVLPKSHPLCAKSSVTAEMIAHERFIFSSEDAEFFYNSNILIASSLNVSHSVEDDLAALPMVESGMGITVMPKLLLDCGDSDVVRKHFSSPRYRTIGLAAQSFENALPIVKLFLETVQEYLSDTNAHIKAQRAI